MSNIGLGTPHPPSPGSKFIPAVLGTVVLMYGGLVFIPGGWGELVDHQPGMMTLISLAIVGLELSSPLVTSCPLSSGGRHERLAADRV